MASTLWAASLAHQAPLPVLHGIHLVGRVSGTPGPAACIAWRPPCRLGLWHTRLRCLCYMATTLWAAPRAPAPLPVLHGVHLVGRVSAYQARCLLHGVHLVGRVSGTPGPAGCVTWRPPCGPRLGHTRPRWLCYMASTLWVASRAHVFVQPDVENCGVPDV